MNFPEKLNKKLKDRIENGALRKLGTTINCVDFSSNDYLGFAKSETIFKQSHQYLLETNYIKNGGTGSRLLSGNHQLYKEVEKQITEFQQSDSALIFNSGYTANLGFFAAIPQRGDVIFYDEFSHASIRDGIQLSNAKAYKFKHNNVTDLEEKIKATIVENSNIYVVTESIFSMDGDAPDLKKIVAICNKHSAYLIVDEAHALGVYGTNGVGMVQQLNLQDQVFARIITFGKALGTHGAVILGCKQLKEYLINFSRSFIYTTSLTPHTLSTIKHAYLELSTSDNNKFLKENIQCFKDKVIEKKISELFIKSNSAIQSCIIPGNEAVKSLAFKLQEYGYDVKPILSPTVPLGKERLRFCLHSYNTKEQINEVINILVKYI